MSDDGPEVAVVEAPAARKKRGRYQISVKLAKTLALLMSGQCRTQQEACDAAGMSKRNLHLALKRENVRAYMQSEIMATLGLSAMRASTKMRELLDSSNAVAAFRSSAYLLNVGAGILPRTEPMVTVNIGSPTGYLIDLRGRDEDRSGPLTERDQAAVDAAREGRAPGVVLLGTRGSPAGPVIDATASEVVDLDDRRSDRDRDGPST
jgi:hypothetical protein